jgi:integrase
MTARSIPPQHDSVSSPATASGRSTPDTLSCPASSDKTIGGVVPAVVEDADRSAPTLDEATIALLSAGVPPNTRRAYASGRRAWSAWCTARSTPLLPPAAADLARYATCLLTIGSPVVSNPRPLSSATVEAHLSAVSTWAVEQGHPRPDLRGARLVLRGHRRQGADRGRGRAAPITVQILAALVDQAMRSRQSDGAPTMRALRDRSALLLGFALAARRSELVAVDLHHLLRVPQGLAVEVWRAKTRATSDMVAVPYAADAELCPVRATLAWRAALQERGFTQGPLLRPVTRTDAVLDRRLGAERVSDIVSELAAAAGVPVPEGFGGFSAHSLRRGLATEMRRAGADQLRISRHGGWADGSTALAGYLVDVEQWEQHPLGGVL